MASWIRKFLSSLYISVVIEDKECQVYGVLVKNGKILKTIEAVFDCNSLRVDPKFNEYIKRQEANVHSLYVSTLLYNPKQWAVPTITKDGYEKFNIDFNNANIVFMPGDWSIFIPRAELSNLTTFLNGLELNLVYSPFALLYDKIIKNGAKSGEILYIYNQKDCISMMVFRDNQMKFSAFFVTAKARDVFRDDRDLKPVDTTDLDNIILTEEDKFNELGSLDDLSNVVGSDKKDTFEDIQNIESDIGKTLEDSVRDIGKETVLLNDIRSAILEYYKNNLYDSDFIEEIVIFDSDKLNKSFIDTLNSELMIKAQIEPINIIKDMSEIMIRELKQ
ncbi:hypothetical protein CIG11343_1331 [Campylobacter iguaniorum]|uniref:hypothetical protein n=1 Tax=Campylobacter iguaniorum TaxID=1244531 RepID=UPI0007C8E588|nr:hypothetical protein [Campylobacter iguaniorum]ANE36333.1 hypothetical protein CIG11343_1331 [Campylobacter iguaniorum]